MDRGSAKGHNSLKPMAPKGTVNTFGSNVKVKPRPAQKNSKSQNLINIDPVLDHLEPFGRPKCHEAQKMTY